MSPADAKKHLAEWITPQGGLYDPTRWMKYRPGESVVSLDGQFTSQDLQAIAALMREFEEVR